MSACAITMGMMLVTSSVATVQCPDFAPETRPRIQLASLDSKPEIPRVATPMTGPQPLFSVSTEDKDGRVSTLVVVTKVKTIRTEVLRANAGQWKGFLTWLAGTGYNLKDIGCYSFRYINKAYTGGATILSEHAKRKACDLNQCDRDKVGICEGHRMVKALPFPPETNAMAHKFGLFPGAEWRGSPDAGHFQVEKVMAEEKQWPVALSAKTKPPNEK